MPVLPQNSLDGNGHQNGHWTSPKGPRLYTAYAICIISKYPYYNALRDCLSWLVSPTVLSLRPQFSCWFSTFIPIHTCCSGFFSVVFFHLHHQPADSAADLPNGRLRGEGEGVHGQTGTGTHPSTWAASCGKLMLSWHVGVTMFFEKKR